MTSAPIEDIVADFITERKLLMGMNQDVTLKLRRNMDLHDSTYRELVNSGVTPETATRLLNIAVRDPSPFHKIEQIIIEREAGNQQINAGAY